MAKKANKKPNRLNEIRVEEGITKAELSRESGIAVATIDLVEKGSFPRMITKINLRDGINKIIARKGKTYQYSVSDLFPE
ncbi:MAG: helix-turn-helix transcriptional regulator [Chloroflexi bacterium]|nr:helix-turn-helix transcriptional regulator [Chloroflexota bacterium]